MKYTNTTELLNIENPYEALKDHKFTIDNKELIEKLTHKELVQFVSNILLKCPDESRSQLSFCVRHIQATEFSKKIGQACVLLRLIDTLKGSNPIAALNNKEFDISLFHEFSFLVAQKINFYNVEKTLLETAPEQKSKISLVINQLKSNSFVPSNVLQQTSSKDEKSEKPFSLGSSADGIFGKTESSSDEIVSPISTLNL